MDNFGHLQFIPIVVTDLQHSIKPSKPQLRHSFTIESRNKRDTATNDLKDLVNKELFWLMVKGHTYYILS